MDFEIVSPYKPTGDQPKAIKTMRDQVRLLQWQTLLKKQKNRL